MSDLCPVYAPFFGAMVRFLGRSVCFGQETLIHRFYVAVRLSGLYQCHRVYMYVFCAIVYLRTPLLTHIPGIGARQVSSLLESRVCRLQFPQWPHILPCNLRLLLCSYGTAKSGVGISATSVLRPDLMMKNSVPVVMAGIIAVSAYTLAEQKNRFKLAIQKIYGLVVSVLISGNRMYPVMASR